jgi:6-phosphogluconolactonase/glucosamine-6-phosphate isomerase/deaminase
MVTGAAKAAAVNRVVSGREPVEELPIVGVAPLHGEMKWYLDAEACGHKPNAGHITSKSE